jgi:hypothetical protein
MNAMSDGTADGVGEIAADGIGIIADGPTGG